MPFGDILSKSNGKVELVTADDQKVVIDSKLKKLGLNIFGIPHTEMRNRSRLIFGNSKLKKNYRVLDAGCGIGLYGLVYAISEPKVKVLGIDLSKDKIRNAKELKKSLKVKNIDFKEGDLTKLKLKSQSMDLAICSDVLEHIPEDRLAVKELARVLKKNSFLLVTFPYNTKHNADVMEKFGHARAGYDEKMIRDLFAKKGFEIIKTKGYSYFFGKIAWYLNERTFKFPALAALLFYPLYLLTYLDVIKIGKPQGIFVKLKKL